MATTDHAESAGDACGGGAGRRLVAVLAVKGLDNAKSRLSPLFDAATRRELVLAMAVDTITAAIAAGVDRVVVVTPDERVARAVVGPSVTAVGEHGVPGTRLAATAAETAIGSGSGSDQVSGSNHESGLNRAYRIGSIAALTQTPDAQLVLLQADLPSLRPDHLRAAVSAATGHRRALIPDRSATGTAALLLWDTSELTTHFGPDSARLHLEQGAVDLIADGRQWPDLRADVDTIDDLRAAIVLGVGPRTAAVVDGITGFGGGPVVHLGANPAPHAS
ncbi:2-phospho-L-lactate guanylyltransferase [Williamsia sp. CHRR-6]|uniref:2-phospho-L-lactate guanylyltransferase n=1 Tax=Williamsia sp. CHRR-6 TaxID=2835871 RepID=UPI001BD92E4C|nr:2-phospho-L-lactate guanylyltransferase [Williamsia sp. CHRR-6]MBT0565431.1 2-phospho-L-lactate guanylyltransferase [Williamsia sp. CHRR-6]